MPKKINEVQEVYSFRVKNLLVLQGFEPIMEVDSPKKAGFKCWIFEATPAFLDAFEGIMKQGRVNK